MPATQTQVGTQTIGQHLLGRMLLQISLEWKFLAGRSQIRKDNEICLTTRFWFV